jgi:hypothetical protein
MAEFINTIDVLGDDAVIDSIIDRSITEFKDNVITIVEQYAFYGCANLRIVDLPNVTTVNSYAFKACTSLTEINIPKCSSDGRSIFNSCTSLKKIVLPAVTSIMTESASNTGYLADCTSLEYVDMSVITSIGGRCFNNCTALTTLAIRTNTVASLASTNAFANTPIAKGTGYVYVPRSLVDSYKAATNWSTYATQFRAIEDWSVDGTLTGEIDPYKLWRQAEIVQDGLALHFDYRGHQDDTSTTITDLASGVTANNFDKFGKTANGVNGGDNNAKYVYLTLKTTDDPFAAFLSAMKNGQGFTLESFGTVCKRSFYFGNKQLYEFGGGSYFEIGGYPISSSTQAVCTLADGTASSTTVPMNSKITVNDTEVNVCTTNSSNLVPNFKNFLHIVTTYSPDGTVRRYFNGYGVNESTTVANFGSWDFDTMFAASATHLPAILSANQLGNTDAQYVSSQRIYSRVLTEDEIETNMMVEYLRQQQIGG